MLSNKFDSQSTNSVKGVALLLLLWHHLFFEHPEFGYWIYVTGILAKVCVATFVFLSGYGFTQSMKLKPVGLKAFYATRLVPIYTNYWFIALITVPLGVIWLGRPLHEAFEGNAMIKFAVQLTGLHRYFYPEQGYNATWWYMSVIIPLIVLFPLIYELVCKYGSVVLLFAFALLIPGKPVVQVLNTWIMPFVLGIWMSHNNWIAWNSQRLAVLGIWRYLLLLIAITGIAWFRLKSPILGDVKIDWLFSVLLVMLVHELGSQWSMAKRVLAYLGGHLFNVFLFHSFIYYYFWAEWLYGIGQPIWIFLTLFSICLALSIVIEYLKKLLLIDLLQKKVIALIQRGFS